MIAKRLHAEKLGFSLTEDTRILVTGGASVNKAIQQVIADVFNASVYIMVLCKRRFLLDNFFISSSLLPTPRRSGALTEPSSVR